MGYLMGRVWVVLSLMVVLVACNQAGSNDPKNPNNLILKANPESYSFVRAALSSAAVDKGVLANDSVPKTYTLSVSQPPAYGVLELSPDGSFSYQHDGSEATLDSFELFWRV